LRPSSPGRYTESGRWTRDPLAESVLASDRRAIKVRDLDGWICHVLRRGAEAMILPD
jgi:hypothetical protein